LVQRVFEIQKWTDQTAKTQRTTAKINKGDPKIRVFLNSSVRIPAARRHLPIRFKYFTVNTSRIMGHFISEVNLKLGTWDLGLSF